MEERINEILKSLEKESLKYFLSQLVEITAIPTGNRSDNLYIEFFKFTKKVEKKLNAM